jgi:glycosyltransferase involved in cell wall biosynthesis
VLHAHYLTEHGFYGTSAAFRPYVVSAWGSDVLVDPATSRLNRSIARFAISRAQLATANNRSMARDMVLKLGAERGRLQHIVIGVSQTFLDMPGESVNTRTVNDRAPVVLSTRALEPLYNIDTIVHAMARVRRNVPGARLVIAGEGSLRRHLELLADKLGVEATFVGHLTQEALHATLLDAEVFVSVPSSDATSVALLQAMSAGAFPIVSELATQQELVDQQQGLRVAPRDEAALAAAISSALEDRERRRSAVERNRHFVESYGLLETNMARMEAWYYRLAGRTGEVELGWAEDSG